LDDPVDEAVDTDRLALARSEDPEPGVEWIEPPPPTAAEEHTFDAFDSRTWNFKPAPTPWYRTGGMPVVVVAVSVAAVALVVSVVLLAFRGILHRADHPRRPDVQRANHVGGPDDDQ